MTEFFPGFAPRRTGRAIDSDHFLPEEAPEETYGALRGFFAGGTD